MQQIPFLRAGRASCVGDVQARGDSAFVTALLECDESSGAREDEAGERPKMELVVNGGENRRLPAVDGAREHDKARPPSATYGRCHLLEAERATRTKVNNGASPGARLLATPLRRD